MERYISCTKQYLIRFYYPHLLVCFLFCILSGLIVSYSNLSIEQSASIIEQYFMFNGIVLMAPLFLWEQDNSIHEVVKAKEMPQVYVYLLRLIPPCILSLVIPIVVELILYLNGSQILGWTMWINSFSELLFLGAIGYSVSAWTNQTVLGYCIAVIYQFISMITEENMGVFSTMHMMMKHYNEWPILLGTAIILSGSGIYVQVRR